MDHIPRRSLGISETAQADATVKPAPPVDPELPLHEDTEAATADIPIIQDESGHAQVVMSDDLKDHISIEIMPDKVESAVHDEL